MTSLDLLKINDTVWPDLEASIGSPSMSPSPPPYMGRGYASSAATSDPAGLSLECECLYDYAVEPSLQTHTAQQSDSEPPLFDIEKDGDPRIKWIMYYDFIVTYTEAYFQLQPGYLPTDKYPYRVQSETSITNGEKRHCCRVPNCKATPFTRHYDLQRHFVTCHQVSKEHGEKEQLKCDYKKCLHTEAFRRDHCREHYREYHYEDLLKKSLVKEGKPKHGKRKPENIDQFLATRITRLDLSWWRCSKCLRRVQLEPDAYTCHYCNIPCEAERVVCRENARKSTADKAQSVGSASALDSAPMNGVGSCGQCQNTWLPDETDITL